MVNLLFLWKYELKYHKTFKVYLLATGEHKHFICKILAACRCEISLEKLENAKKEATFFSTFNCVF